MAETTTASPSPRKRLGWLRVLAWILAALIVLLVALYFIATSSAFVKGVVLPRVGAALHAQVTVSDAAVHPFRQIVLRDLKVRAPGQPPVLTAPEVRVDYSLMDILGGNLHVDDIALVSPTVQLVEHPDGSSNLDPILKALRQKPPTKKPAPAKPSQPLRIDLRQLVLTNATIVQIKQFKSGEHNLLELTNVNVTLANLRNGQSGKLNLEATIAVRDNPPAPAMFGLLRAGVQGRFAFALAPDLTPTSVHGNLGVGVTRAGGTLEQLDAWRAALDCDFTPTDIKQVALRFQKAGVPLGELLASGPFDLEKTEGRLNVELLSVDKRLLNLLGAKSGLDFGTTALSSTNEIQLSNAGALIAVNGRFDADKLQLSRAGQTTPVLNLHAAYAVTVDRAQDRALLRTLALTGLENNRPLLEGKLTQPMTFSWGGAAPGAGDSRLSLTLTNFNLADWKPFFGNAAPAGDANLTAHLLSQQSGKHLSFDLDSQIANFSARLGSHQITRATLTLKARGEADDFAKFGLDNVEFGLARDRQPVVTLSGSGSADLTNQTAAGQLTLRASLPKLVQLAAQPGLAASSGTVELKARLAKQPNAQTVTGTLALAEFTGEFGSTKLRNVGVAAKLDIGLTPTQVAIREITGTLTQADKPGGTFNLSGTYDVADKTAQLNAGLSDFNQNGLGPFLQPLLADRKLVSVALNGNALVQYNPAGNSMINAALQVTNLVVHDPQHQIPATPLAAGLTLDASLGKQTADLRKLQLALTPTDRATNLLQLSGQVNFAHTNAIQGNLTLASDSLDLTRYYDLFSAQSKSAAPATTAPSQAAPPAQSPAAAAEQEPPAKKLPLENFVANAAIGKLYLREIEITNLVANALINGGHVVVKPCRLALNGAPVSAAADVDLGVPGYKYAVSFSASQVPFAPLVDTFAPDRKGQLGGALSAQAQLSGAGALTADWEKNLTGTFDIGTTNLDLSVINIHSKLLQRTIDVVAAVPELIHNPEAGIASVVGGLMGRGGLTSDLEKSPIDVITARGKAGAGRVDVEQAVVRSPAFEAQTAGPVVLNPVLTNSTIQFPVTISLSRPIAERLNLAANTPTNQAYAALPNFVSMTRTLGDPHPQINKPVLLRIAAESIGINVQGGKFKPGTLLNDVRGFLSRPATNTTNTNQPATNQSPIGNLLNRFLHR